MKKTARSPVPKWTPLPSYCADILVPKDHGERIVMTGAFSTTLAECRQKALESAGYYTEGGGYSYALVHLHALCGACEGAGRLASTTRSGRRVPYGWEPCAHCMGLGCLFTLTDRPRVEAVSP